MIPTDKPKKFKKPMWMLKVEEYEHCVRQHEDSLAKQRARNGVLMTALVELAPKHPVILESQCVKPPFNATWNPGTVKGWLCNDCGIATDDRGCPEHGLIASKEQA